MTKSREAGENEMTEEAKRRAKDEKRDVCSILSEMLEAAKDEKDRERTRRIIKAQKYLGCRNIRERRGR